MHRYQCINTPIAGRIAPRKEGFYSGNESEVVKAVAVEHDHQHTQLATHVCSPFHDCVGRVGFERIGVSLYRLALGLAAHSATV